VREVARPVLGHCRTLLYLRGKRGVVAAVHGRFRNPELLAYNKPGLPARVLYKVRFKQRDLWGRYLDPPATDWKPTSTSTGSSRRSRSAPVHDADHRHGEPPVKAAASRKRQAS
jgi:hypothetical protein